MTGEERREANVAALCVCVREVRICSDVPMNSHYSQTQIQEYINVALLRGGLFSHIFERS